ncbi:MAG: hypothetical protein R6W68_16845 [Ignavibacteriaceae bacterium]
MKIIRILLLIVLLYGCEYPTDYIISPENNYEDLDAESRYIDSLFKDFLGRLNLGENDTPKPVIDFGVKSSDPEAVRLDIINGYRKDIDDFILKTFNMWINKAEDFKKYHKDIDRIRSIEVNFFITSDSFYFMIDDAKSIKYKDNQILKKEKRIFSD